MNKYNEKTYGRLFGRSDVGFLYAVTIVSLTGSFVFVLLYFSSRGKASIYSQ